MPRFGLRHQLTAWFLFIGVVPIVAGIAYLYTVTRTELVRESTMLMRGDADGTVDRLDEAFGVLRGELVLAARQVAQRVLESKSNQRPRARSKGPPRYDFDPAVRVLASWGRGAPVSLETWGIVDRLEEPRVMMVDGEPGAAGALSDDDRALAVAAQSAPDGSVVFGRVGTSIQTARRVLTLATPVIGNDGDPIGSLHGEIPVEWFQRALAVRSTPGGSLWVFDGAGSLVLTTDARTEPDDVARAIFGHGRSDGGERPARVQIGADALGAVSMPLAVTGLRAPWTVAVSAPEQMITAKAQPWRSAAVGAALAIVVAFVALMVSAMITRPIRTMEEGTRRIAQGDLDFDLQVRGHNELGQLGGSFQQMAYALKRAQERLNKTERMAAIGEVSLAMHHELNQSLTTVIDAAALLKARPDVPATVRDHMIPIYDGAMRMREMIQRLERVNDQPTESVRGLRLTDLGSIPARQDKAEGAA